MNHLQVAVGALLASLALPAARAGVIYSNSLQNGPAPGWQTTAGAWSWDGDGLKDASPAESRIFLPNADGPGDALVISFDAAMGSGVGWSIFFKTRLAAGTNAATGFSFGIERSEAVGVHLFKRWENDAQSHLAAMFFTVDESVFHNYSLSITGSSLTVARDGQTILNYIGGVQDEGDLFGFRVHPGSEATFRNLSIETIPGPGSAAALAGLAGWLLRRRR